MHRWRGRNKTAAAGGDDLPPLPLRRRVLIAALAVAAALTVVLMLVYRPGDPKRGLQFAPAQPTIDDGRRVGGKAEVILIAPAASR